MKSDIFISEVVDTREVGKDIIEVCANVDGRYDRASSTLEIKQDAYLQNPAGEQFRPSWFPQGETIREHLPHEEIQELGRSIFHRWVKRVREAVPQEMVLS